MKKATISLAFVFLGLCSFSSGTKESYPNPAYADFAQPTPTKDTLYLLSGDEMARVTYNLWKSDSTWKGNNPTIKFVNKSEMVCIKERLRMTVITQR